MSRPLYLRRILPLVLVVGVCLGLDARATPPQPLLQLTRVMRSSGVSLAPRLSVLPDVEEARGTVGPLSRREQRILTQLRDASGGTHAPSLHRSAIIDLAWSEGAPVEKVDGVIASLHTVMRLRPATADVLADLSAAHLVRAERAESLGDLLRAVQAARDALALDARHPAALYNLALALDWMTLDDQAMRAWEAVAAARPRSEAARRARARVREIRASVRAPRPMAGASPTEWAAYAAREPQEARLAAMETLLGGWGQATLRGDRRGAERWLAAASAVGGALERRAGGDRSLADQVRAIRAAGPDAERTLARAHVVYRRGQRLVDARMGDSAFPAMDSVHALAQASPVLREWAAYWRGVALFYQGRVEEGIFRGAIARADERTHPALAARAHWSLGTALVRRGAYDSARVEFAHAARLYERAGEREHLGAMQMMDAETLMSLGDEPAAFAASRVALATLRPYRGSQWLHNVLRALGWTATLTGLDAAALALTEEDVAVGMRVRPGVHAEALLARSRTLAEAGYEPRALADARQARRLLGLVASPREHDWLTADLQFTEAGLQVRGDPARAAAALDSVVLFFRGVTDRLLPALVLRAEARIGAGDVAAGVVDLDSAAVRLGRLSGDVKSARLRAAMLEAGRGVFDRLAMQRVRQGNPRLALAALERGRVSFASAPGTAGRAAEGIAGPAGAVAVDYALVGDTLLTFTIADTAVRLETQRVDRARLLRAAEHARVAMELRLPADSAAAELALLYDALIRPVRARLRPGTPLVVVADGEIAGIPFAALRDTARGRWLLEEYEIRFAGTLADARRAGGRADASAAALFVADPAFRPEDHPGLSRLSALATQAREIAAWYPRGEVVTGAGATPGALRTRLQSAGIFHFAGHAIFDDERPDRSYLLLAGPAAAGTLTAADIRAMDLRGVRLVVLSACETQRASGGRSGGWAGLSGAMLDAGAGGVVGSLWRVNEGMTRALMAEFHRAYRSSGNASAALRQAQLTLLRSPDPALRSPAAWAGFRYAGG